MHHRDIWRGAARSLLGNRCLRVLLCWLGMLLPLAPAVAASPPMFAQEALRAWDRLDPERAEAILFAAEQAAREQGKLQAVAEALLLRAQFAHESQKTRKLPALADAAMQAASVSGSEPQRLHAELLQLASLWRQKQLEKLDARLLSLEQTLDAQLGRLPEQEQRPYRQLRLDALLLRALIASNQARPEEARAAAQAALDATKAMGDARRTVLATYARALAEQTAQDFEQQRQWGERAVRLAGQADLPRWVVQSRIVVSRAMSVLDNSEKGLRYRQETLRYAKQFKDLQFQAMTTQGYAFSLQRLGRHSETVPLLRSAIASFEALGDPIPEADSRVNLGIAYRELGRYPESLQLYREARNIYEPEQDWEGAGNTANNIGSIYEEIGDHANMLLATTEALALRRKSKDRFGEGISLANMGLAYLGLKRHEEAITHAEQALAIAREVKDDVGVGFALNFLGEVYREQGQFEQSRKLIEEALPVFAAMGAKPDEAEARLQLSSTLLSLRRGAEAEQSALLGLRTLEPMQHAEQPSVGNHNLMQALRLQGRKAEAIFYGKRAVNIQQALRRGGYGLGPEARKALRRNARPYYQGLAELLLEENRLAEAAQTIDLLREDEYQDFASESGSVPHTLRLVLTVSEQRAERRLDAAIRQLAAAEQSASGSEAQSARRIHQAEQALQQARRRIQVELAASASPALTAAGRKIVEAPQGLLASQAPQAGLLYVLLGDERLHLLLVTAEGFHHALAPGPASTVLEQARAYSSLLRNPERDPLPMAQQLYAQLLAPMAGALNRADVRHLQLRPDGALRYLPFAALHDGQDWLLRRYSVAVQSGALRQKAVGAATPLSVAGLGRTQGDEENSPLPNVALELQGIVRSAIGTPPEEGLTGVFPGVAYLDAEFTRGNLERALSGEFPLVHIATHFRLSPRSESESFLLLGDGTRLSLSDLRQSRRDLRRVRLISLSACETALDQPSADGRDVDGLAGTLLSQGSESVLASLWPVEDASTSLLMHSLYSGLKAQNMQGAEALRQSQLALLDGKLELQMALAYRRGKAAPRGAAVDSPTIKLSHPYFWAPFVWMDRAPAALAP